MTDIDEAAFESLGKIKTEDFKMPDWAANSFFPSEKPGESSKPKRPIPTSGDDEDELDDANQSSDEEEVWEDAEDGLVGDNPAAKLFSNAELRVSSSPIVVE